MTGVATVLAPSLSTQAWFRWALVLVLGFPVLVLVLGEVVHRLEQRGTVAARPLALARNVVLPLVVVVLFVRFVLERAPASPEVRVTTTVALLVGLVVVLTLVSAVVFGSADPDSWRGRAPRLLVDMVRAVLVAVGAAIVIGSVWGVNLGALLAAIGVGGLALGLALQDTLASLLAGISLLSEKPFTVGDWIEFDGHDGLVTDINWRTVRLRTRGEDLVVVPNVVFGQSVVLNNSRPDVRHLELVPLGFSYDDPPRRVHQVLLDVARSTPGVLADPPPEVRTMSYDDSSIGYEARLHMPDVDGMPRVRAEFLTRVWYAARRHGLTIPYPIRTVHHSDAAALDARAADEQRARRERAVDGLASSYGVSRGMGDEAHLEHYTTGEVMLRAGEQSSSLVLVLQGEAVASVTDEDGREHEVGTIGEGEFFGELATVGRRANLLTVRARDDVEVVVLPATTVRTMVAGSERFAAELQQVIQARRAQVERLHDQVVAAAGSRTSAAPVSPGPGDTT